MYLYSGEQNDPNLGFYYLRARYYAQNYGRFTSVDPHEGDISDPRSLHRYLYAGVDPVNKRDPSGQQFTLVELSLSIAIDLDIESIRFAYYASLVDFAVNAVGCIDCLINPGYALQSRALNLGLTDPDYGGVASMLYQQGGDLVLRGYQKLGERAADVTFNSGLDALVKSITLVRQTIYTELLGASQGAVTVTQTKLKLASLKDLYDGAGAVRTVIQAFEKGDQPQECVSLWSLGSFVVGLLLP